MEHGNYVVSGKAANRFRSLAIAHLDLRVAKDMIDRCVDDIYDEENRDLEEALWTTALIRFRRAFSGGRGEQWTHEEAIAALDQTVRRSYGKFRMLADQFIAHSVGVGEDMAVTAVVGPGPEPFGAVVYGATVRKARVCSPGTDLAKEFRSLLEILISSASTLEEQARVSLLLEIKTWPSTELTKGGLYSKSVNFDDDSPLYMRSMRKYTGTA